MKSWFNINLSVAWRLLGGICSFGGCLKVKVLLNCLVDRLKIIWPICLHVMPLLLGLFLFAVDATCFHVTNSGMYHTFRLPIDTSMFL